LSKYVASETTDFSAVAWGRLPPPSSSLFKQHTPSPTMLRLKQILIMYATRK